MMRTLGALLLTSFLLAPVQAAAVDVCRWAETTTDLVDGTSTFKLARHGLTIEIEDGKGYVSIPVSLGGINAMGIPAGTEILMLLENGTRIRYFTARDSMPKGTAYATQYSAGVYSTWTLRWPLSAEAAHAVAQSPPIAMRYSLGENEIKPDYSPAVGRRLQVLFACAAHHL